MRLLLDTNALLWAMTNAPRIAPVRDVLVDSGNEVYASAVSWWEIAIKTAIGKLDANISMLRAAAEASGFRELPLMGVHAEILTTLPRHHNDPFDHMIVAQAIAEPMKLVTGDSILKKYLNTIILI
ncbi:MAG: type II toxin-antitoxin system VapC family toxin [Desulfovibrio sp.]|nr:type II toxin-antitoxin system VapC family toxin [Desulfovibrio sp.]